MKRKRLDAITGYSIKWLNLKYVWKLQFWVMIPCESLSDILS